MEYIYLLKYYIHQLMHYNYIVIVHVYGYDVIHILESQDYTTSSPFASSYDEDITVRCDHIMNTCTCKRIKDSLPCANEFG